MSHLTGLRINNYACFRGEQEIGLGPGCYAILAEHEQDKGRSNAAGKSTFGDLIRWCLEGKIPNRENANTLDDLISEGQDEMSVEIEFSDGLFVSRQKARGKSASLVVQLPGVEKELKQDEAQDALERHLGLSAEDRLTTCWSEQGELANLVRSTSSVTTKMIEGWLGSQLEKLAEAHEYVCEQATEASARLAKAIQKRDEAKAKAELVEERRALADVAEEEYQALRKEYDEWVKGKEERALRAQLTTLKAELYRLTQVRNQTKPFAFSVEPVASGEEEKLRKKSEKAKTAAEVQATEAKRLKLLVKGVFDGACPVSPGFECPAKAKINSRTEENRKAYEEAERASQDSKEELAKIIQPLSDLVKRRNARESEERQAVRYEAELKSLDEKLEGVKRQVDALEAKGVIPLNGDEPIKHLAPPSDYKGKLAEGLYEESRKAAAELPALETAITEAMDDIKVYVAASRVLGPEGARKKICEGAASTIASECSSSLGDAGINLQVSPLWGREVAALADNCESCGHAFPSSAKVKKCELCNTPRGNKFRHEFKWKLTRVSGAMKDLGGLGLRTSGYKWLKKRTGSAWSVAFLDEVAGQLDESHRRSVSAGIRKLLVGTYEQAFVTAHDRGSLEACDKRLLIVSDGKWSKIHVV